MKSQSPMGYQFDSQVHLGFKLEDWSQDVVKNEPMLFNCDLEHALKFGGPITHNFLSSLTFTEHTGWSKEDKIVIDSRVHMSFRPGIYLAILTNLYYYRFINFHCG